MIASSSFCGPADGQLREPRLAAASRAVKGRDELAVGGGCDEPVADLAGELGRLRPARGDHDLGRLLGQRVETGVLDRVVRPPVARQAALPELAHHLHRLAEHLATDEGRRPPVSEHVLVEVLPGADAEEEPSRQHRRARRGRLRDDRRVHPDHRARHPCPDPQPLGLHGDATEH